MKDPVTSAYEMQMAELTRENKELASALAAAMRKITVYETGIADIETRIRATKWTATR